MRAIIPTIYMSPNHILTSHVIHADVFIANQARPLHFPPLPALSHPPDSCLGAKEAAELLASCTADLKALRKLQRASASGDQHLSPAECAARTKQLLGAIGHTVDSAMNRWVTDYSTGG